VKTFTVRKLFIPYIFFQIGFVLYFNVFLEPFLDKRDVLDYMAEKDSVIIDEWFIDQLVNGFQFGDEIINQIVIGSELFGYEVVRGDKTKLLTDLMMQVYKATYFSNTIFWIILLIFASYFFLNEVR